MCKAAIRLPWKGFEETQKKRQCSTRASLIWLIPMTKKGISSIWERRFRACWTCFIRTGFTAPELQQETASVAFLAASQSGSLKWGWRRKEGKSGELWRQVLPSPHLYLCRHLHSWEFKAQFTLLHFRYQKHWSYEPNHFVLPLQSMERKRRMSKRDESSLRVSSSWDEPRSCYLLSLNQKLTITSLSSPFLFPACDKNFALFLGSSILLCLAWGEKGKGSFLMGSSSKWIIARRVFLKPWKGDLKLLYLSDHYEHCKTCCFTL